MASEFVSHAEEVRKRVNAHALKNLHAATIFVQRAAKKNVKPGGPSGFKTSHGSAGLSGSIGREIEARKLRGRVGTNLKYARIQEQGGTITAKNKKLTVPISDEAKKSRGATFMNDLQLIPRKGGNSLLARIGENFALDVHWVLVDSVTLPAHPYLRPAINSNRAAITKLLLRPMPKGKK